MIVQTKRWDVGLATLQVPASALRHDKHYGGKNVTIRNQPSCRNHPNSWFQPLCSSALHSPLSFRAAYRFAAFVGMFPLSDFTPHLAVSASEETVSETGVSRCRQLAATLPSVGGNCFWGQIAGHQRIANRRLRKRDLSKFFKAWNFADKALGRYSAYLAKRSGAFHRKEA